MCIMNNFEYKFDLFCKDNDLTLEISIKSLSRNIRKFSTSMVPFAVYHEDEELMYKTYVVTISNGKDNPIYLRQNEIYTLKYPLSETLKFLPGCNDYRISYLKDFLEIDTTKKFDTNLVRHIKFQWCQMQDSDKGFLVGDVLYPTDQ